MKKIDIALLLRNTMLIALCSFMFQCTSTKGPKLVDPKAFDGTIDGKKVALYTLKNKNGMEMQVTNYGAKVVSLFAPDKNGVFTDVVLGYKSLKGYQEGKEIYFGSAIGRYGNRIGKGKFTLDNVEYKLATNDGPNHLHGGLKGFNKAVWDATQVGDSALILTYVSKDMEEGYPGNLTVKMTYTLTSDNAFKIEYSATTDKKTICNITHHSFFNLAGEGSGPILNHLLTINADAITPVDTTLIPTGEIRPVEGTPMDFRKATAIGERINQNYDQLKCGKGYDHNWVLNKAPKVNGLTFAASVKEPVSGRVMEVYTSEPGLQFYAGNFLKGTEIGKSGKAYDYRGAFCLETQHFPDSPNKPSFPSVVLEPGKTYSHVCIYKFKAE
ncbi:MAG: aldose epimerase family protein [Bacteroidota bacterium]|nr:aldose epimerase family protein [Bacteroidota bacterium]